MYTYSLKLILKYYRCSVVSKFFCRPIKNRTQISGFGDQHNTVILSTRYFKNKKNDDN